MTADEASIELPQFDSERLLAQAITPGNNAVAVTFSAECADEFTSAQYLAPGNPVLTQFVNLIRDANEDPQYLVRQTEPREDVTEHPVLCGWD